LHLSSLTPFSPYCIFFTFGRNIAAMKKFILLLFIFCLQLLPAKAQWVTIPDANFATKLQQLYPTCMNGNLMDTTCSDIVNATSLMVGYLNIANLSGVEYFDNLTNLSCYNNQLTSLPSLPHNLIDLWCYDNQLSNLPNLPVSITNIQCYNNQLTSLPNLPPNLTQLTCNNNQLSALPLLPDSINDLDCSFNLLTYLPPLPPFVMNNLIINDNNISCINNIPMFNLLYNFFPNPITCIPNEPAVPPLGLPLCMENDQVNNPNNCPSNFNISGSVYSDQNGNCMFDATDLGSNNISIRIYDSSNMLVVQTYSINGAYGFSINLPGIYKVKLEGINIPIATTCAQADSQMVNLLSINNFLNNIDFPVTCIQDFDAYVHSVNPLGLVFPPRSNTSIKNKHSKQPSMVQFRLRYIKQFRFSYNKYHRPRNLCCTCKQRFNTNRKWQYLHLQHHRFQQLNTSIIWSSIPNRHHSPSQ